MNDKLAGLVIGVGGTLLVVAIGGMLQAGDLEPDGPPAPTMHTLEEIYQAVQAVQAPTTTYQFVGTTGNVSPGIGFLGLTEQCQIVFGATARMCTTEDILETVNLAGVSWNTDAGWLRPVVAGTSFLFDADGNGGVVLMDPSGFTRNEVFPDQKHFLTCDGWANPSPTGRGLMITRGTGYEGRISFAACHTPGGVACCS